MSINKKVISATVVVALSGVSMMANAAPSADVTLTGIITNTTCDITVNGGQANLNVGAYKAQDIIDAGVLAQVGAVPLPVELTNCEGPETGSLVIQGNTSNLDVSNKLFTSATTDTVGFMIKDVNTTNIVEGQGVPLPVTAEGPNTYSFTVGMASATDLPLAGAYRAPITISYIVN